MRYMKNEITERKYTIFRVSITPLLIASKCVWKPTPPKSSGATKAISWSMPKKKKKHRKAANTKEMIWLLLIDDAHKPTEAKVATSKNKAM